MSFQPINPKPYLQSLINKQVIIKLKFNNIEYQGKLLSVDNYMNLLLDSNVLEIDYSNEEEPISTELGDELFIRCNNVLWVGEKLKDGEEQEEQEEQEDEGGEKEEDTKME